MNSTFILALKNTLSKSIVLLESISSDNYTIRNVGPYYSSIGGHVRHILDFYESIFRGLNKGVIDLTDRNRDQIIETVPLKAKALVERYLDTLSSIPDGMLDNRYELIDDFGMGKQSLPTNLSSVLAQANSHTIHHYAIISQILFANGITIEDQTFGYNPSTPIEVNRSNR